MQIEYEPVNSDEPGGNLLLTCENVHEVRTAYDVRTPRGSDDELMEAMVDLSRGVRPCVRLGQPDRLYYPVRVELGFEWVAPYLAELRVRTGCDVVPDIDIPGLVDVYHTLVNTEVSMGPNGFCFVGYRQAGEHMGKPGDYWASKYAEEAACKLVGVTKPRREFILVDSSRELYRRNPDYAKGPAPVDPGVDSREVWHAIADWWVSTQASPSQLELLKIEKDEPPYRNYEGYIHSFHGSPTCVFVKTDEHPDYVPRDAFIDMGQGEIASA